MNFFSGLRGADLRGTPRLHCRRLPPLFLVAVLLAGGCAQQPGSVEGQVDQQTASKHPPNVVVILADDLGFSDIGFFGSEIATPNVDRLAAGGLSLTQFYVSPRCSPTRASLLTGRDPHTAGLGFLTAPRGMQLEPGPYQGYLSIDTPSLAEALKSSGYQTYMSGKWHLGEDPAHWPRRRGFDRYFGLISGASSYYEIIRNQRMDRRMAADDEEWSPPAEGFYMTDAITEQAVAFLEAHQAGAARDAPFLLYLAYTAPHWPLHAPAEDIERYRDRYQAGPRAIFRERFQRLQQLDLVDPALELEPEVIDEEAAWAERMAVYAAMVSVMDRGIGRVIDTLQRQGLLDDTLVLFFSDNGACAELVEARGLHQEGTPVGARGSYRAYGPDWASASNTPLRNHKGSTLEGGIRTPLILHWPAGMSALGRVDNRSIVSVQDIMPTVLRLAGNSSGDALPGQDLQALFGGGEVRRDTPLFWEHVDWRGVRDGRWKAVFDPQARHWSLFDLEIDPYEGSDLAVSHAERVKEMSVAWQRWADDVGVKPFAETPFGRLYRR